MSITNIFVIAIIALLAYQFIKTKMSLSKPELLKTMIQEGVILVDVRTPSEFSGGSAKGAVNIPLDSLSSNLDKLHPDKNIIVFCRSGNRSAQAKSILEKNGYAKVANGGTWSEVNKLV